MLKDRVSGRIIPNSNPGRQPYLSREEEKELMDFVILCSSLGSDVLSVVEATLCKKGKKIGWANYQ